MIRRTFPLILAAAAILAFSTVWAQGMGTKSSWQGEVGKSKCNPLRTGGKPENRRSGKDRWKCSPNHGMSSFVSGSITVVRTSPPELGDDAVPFVGMAEYGIIRVALFDAKGFSGKEPARS